MSQQFRVTQGTCMECGQVHEPPVPKPGAVCRCPGCGAVHTAGKTEARAPGSLPGGACQCATCGAVHTRAAGKVDTISDEEFSSVIEKLTAAIAYKTGRTKAAVHKLVSNDVPPPPSLAKRFQDSAPLLRDEIEPTYPVIIRTAGAEVNGVPPPPSLIATIQASAKRNLKRK